jgi:hypothetical protein
MSKVMHTTGDAKQGARPVMQRRWRRSSCRSPPQRAYAGEGCLNSLCRNVDRPLGRAEVFMRMIRMIRQALFGLASLAIASIAGPGFANDLPADPILRIEAGMHTSLVTAVSLSADEKVLATGSYDKTVRLWSVPVGRLLRTLRMPIGPGFGGGVFATALSPDGSIVAAGGWDASCPRTASLRDIVQRPNRRHSWSAGTDAKHYQHPRIFPGRRAPRRRARPGRRQVWAAPSWNQVWSDDACGDQVYGANFASDGGLATASNDGNIRLYNSSLRLVAEAPGARRQVAPIGRITPAALGICRTRRR